MKRFCLALIILSILGCTRSANEEQVTSLQPTVAPRSTPVPTSPEPLIPPRVERGRPILYSRAEHDPRPFLEKTQSDKRKLWFVFLNDNHWYINWDAERQPFNLIVIHHSATSPQVTAESISTGQKERLYAPRYRSGNNDPYVKGLPPHSGHVVNGKETFIGYHHLVYEDGRVTTELSLLVKIGETWLIDMVGWHAGNWEVNCRSIGICLVGDFTDKQPAEAQLTATARLIAHYRKFNPDLTVKPHHTLSATECPGKTWQVWGNQLME